MGLNRFISVDYTEVSPAICFDTKGEFVKHAPVEREWGSVSFHQFSAPNINLVYFEGRINHDLHIREHSPLESTTVNSCFSLSGNISSNFKGLNCPMKLHKGLQNYIYKPEVDDDHYIQKQQDPLRLLHLAVDRKYFTNLLDDNIQWCALLKEKILSRNIVYGISDEMEITPKMNGILLDLLHCPLTGPLQKMVVEAKVLELIAYQLDYFYREGNSSQAINACERESFYALRNYLAENYNEEHSLQSLCRAFCLNEFKLKKGFKELFGNTVFGYIHSLRMEHARTLILDEKLSVNVVAGKVGYKNPNHFSTAFKKQFGITPSMIR